MKKEGKNNRREIQNIGKQPKERAAKYRNNSS